MIYCYYVTCGSGMEPFALASIKTVLNPTLIASSVEVLPGKILFRCNSAIVLPTSLKSCEQLYICVLFRRSESLGINTPGYSRTILTVLVTNDYRWKPLPFDTGVVSIALARLLKICWLWLSTEWVLTLVWCRANLLARRYREEPRIVYGLDVTILD